MKLSFFFLLLINIINVYPQSTVSLNSNWVKLDEKIISDVSNFFLQQNYSYSYFRKKIKNTDVIDVELLLGAKRIKIAIHGGYTSIYLVVILKKDEMIYINSKLDLDKKILIEMKKNNSKIKKMLMRWKEQKKKNDTRFKHFYISYFDTIKMHKHYQLIDRFLGKKKEIHLKGNLKKHYNLLMYPTQYYPYAIRVSKADSLSKSAERQAIDELVNQNRFDLIRNILRGYNPDGQAYALEALIINDKLKDAKTVLSIKKLMKLPYLFTSIVGCIKTYENYSYILKIYKKKIPAKIYDDLMPNDKENK